MRVYVSSPHKISPQILAYAEYRVFAVLARCAGVHGARVVLRQEATGRVRCSVTIALDSMASVRAHAQGRHAAGTIDRAAERVVHRLRRLAQASVLKGHACKMKGARAALPASRLAARRLL
jgi:ribosome-associated translation inhibitor RaiA